MILRIMYSSIANIFVFQIFSFLTNFPLYSEGVVFFELDSLVMKLFFSR